MKKMILGISTVATLALSCSQKKEIKSDEPKEYNEKVEINPTYTFISISTAKPGKLNDLVRIASKPSQLMDENLEGLLARQVSVDTSRNSVIVWATFDKKETLYNHLMTEEGQNDHGDQAEMDSIIETFTMYDLTPKSQRLTAKN